MSTKESHLCHNIPPDRHSFGLNRLITKPVLQTQLPPAHCPFLHWLAFTQTENKINMEFRSPHNLWKML